MTGISGKYYAKLLLFGEYSVITGSEALIAPFRNFSGRLCIPSSREKKQEKALKSNDSLKRLSDYLKSNEFESRIDLQKLESDIKKGLFFDSDIPLSYGAGSSGALCASVYKSYCTEKNLQDPEDLKKMFSLMESHFHGRSSGIDPLCCYLGEPLLINSEKTIKPVIITKKKDDDFGLFLIDSGFTSDTGPLVNHYLEKMKDEKYAEVIYKEYIPMVNGSIGSFLSGRYDELNKLTAELSALQIKYFRRMIPDEIIPLWESALESGFFSLKICGSGGGGFIMAITNDRKRFQQFADDNRLTILEPMI